jgi:transcriptional regulator with XRE-family HTH domain
MADEHRAVRLRIGRRIKEIRLLQGLTQETLAGRLGRDQKDVSSLERGTVNMTIESLASVAAAFSIDVADLVQPTSPSGKRSDVLSIRRRDLDDIERVVQRMRQANEPRARAKSPRVKKR